MVHVVHIIIRGASINGRGHPILHLVQTPKRQRTCVHPINCVALNVGAGSDPERELHDFLNHTAH